MEIHVHLASLDACKMNETGGQTQAMLDSEIQLPICNDW
jgi:hypothetical protein